MASRSMVKKILMEVKMKPETMRFKIGFWTWVSLGPIGVWIAVIGKLLQNNTVIATGIWICCIFFIPMALIVIWGTYTDNHPKKEKIHD